MKKTILYRLIPATLMLLFSAANAAAIKFDPAFDSGYVSGQFVCTEINQYGSLDYACGGHGSNGSIQGIAAKQVIDLPSTFLMPYHTSKKIHISSVYITHFRGEIQNSGERMIWCQFPDKKLTKPRDCIILHNDGKCEIKPVCKD